MRENAERAPTIVAVHGAGGGGWEWGIWARVLGVRGFNVLAPDLMPSAGDLARTSFLDYRAQVLDWSRAQVALMRPHRGMRALEAIMRDLIDTEVGATYFAERVWNASLRYDLGDGHPLTGRGAPDFTLTDGAKPNLLMQGGAGLLLDFDSDASLEALAASWGGRIVYRAGEAEDRLGLGALLVRPDGVVAWARDAGAAAAAAGACVPAEATDEENMLL